MKAITYLLLLVFIIPGKIITAQSPHGTGALLMDENEYKRIPLASTAGMGTLPASKDLSAWFPTPGDQGMQSSCVAWAVSYGLKSYQEAVESKMKPDNISKCFSPSYLYNQIKIGSCSGGSYIYQALDLLKREGVARLNEFPYNPDNCVVIPDASIKARASSYKIADWRTVDIQNEMEVKSQLASNFPVVILMQIDNGFEHLPYNTVYTGPNGKEVGFHAMVVVGYDDSKSAYKVLNSWGTSWGTNGYCWISYAAFRSRVKEAYTAQDIVIIDPSTINTTPPTVTPTDLPDSHPLVSSNLMINLSQPTIIHNQLGNSPYGWVYGMTIIVPGTITGGKNSSGQLVVRFYYPNGRPLYANAQEMSYRDVNGLCAAGTQLMPILYDPADLSNIQIFIPYYALNLQPSGGQNWYYLAVIASFYINNFEKARSQLTYISIRY